MSEENGEKRIDLERKVCYVRAVKTTMQPLIIYKTQCGRYVGTKRFRSTAEAVKWLRSEGCRFSNSDLCGLGEDSLELFTEDCEYEVEVAARQPKRRSRGDV